MKDNAPFKEDLVIRDFTAKVLIIERRRIGFTFEGRAPVKSSQVNALHTNTK